jgi:hypothetical protein
VRRTTRTTAGKRASMATPVPVVVVGLGDESTFTGTSGGW